MSSSGVVGCGTWDGLEGFVCGFGYLPEGYEVGPRPPSPYFGGYSLPVGLAGMLGGWAIPLGGYVGIWFLAPPEGYDGYLFWAPLDGTLRPEDVGTADGFDREL